MRRIFLPLLLFLSIASFAQVPDAFNYQAVVRDATGEVVASQPILIRISILQNLAVGTVVYSETHSVSTNQFGLANLEIGRGDNSTGVFSPGGWGITDHYLKVEIALEGISSFIHMGTSQLLSVPYAFHAQTVEDDQVDDADADPTNELQTLSLEGNQLSLSADGGNVTLSTGGGTLWTEYSSGIYRTDGNVGIGTSNPLSRLSVGGDGADNATIFGNATNGVYYGGHFITDHYSGKAVRGEAISEQGTGVHGTAAGENGWGVYGYATGNSGRGVYGQAAGTSAFAGYFSGKVYMDNLVGIGETLPETPLDVLTNAQFDPGNHSGKTKGSILLRLTEGEQGLGNYGPALSFGGINTGRRRAAIAAVQTTADPDHVGLAFFTHPSPSTANEIISQRMVITHGGNVGIGTASPQATLDVNGNLKVNGSYNGFPRPAYDSGWEWLEGNDKVFSHNLGGDVNNYVVELMSRNDMSSNGNITNRGAGLDVSSIYLGFYWLNLTTSSIEVRLGQDERRNYVRVRIWVYN